jgi:GT2 family glycosyltransferase
MLKKLITASKLYVRLAWSSARILWFGFLQGNGVQCLKNLSRMVSESKHLLLEELNLYHMSQKGMPTKQASAFFDKIHVQKLQCMSRNIHTRLALDSECSFSILLLYQTGKFKDFQIALESALNQSSPRMEVIVGFLAPPSDKMEKLTLQLRKQYGAKLKTVFTNESDPTDLYHHLVQKASGNFLVFHAEDGVMRPDLLLRFEQTWRMMNHDDKAVLCCNEYLMHHNNNENKANTFFNPDHFPYVFSTYLPTCWGFSKKLWHQVGGLRKRYAQSGFYDLILRFDLNGAHIKKIPLPLFSRRRERACTEKDHIVSAMHSLQDYLSAKQIHWKIEEGFLPGLLRAIPPFKKRAIHAIVPFKNQKKFTLRAAESLLRQIEVDLKITAVDNGSSDHSITPELEALGIEVLRIDEPFNFSRINNLAVAKSEMGKPCELLFFMNNDVELDPEALAEMSRWIDQPKIGIVGCRLNYPNGLLQCGGVELNKKRSSEMWTWTLSENRLPFEKLQLEKALHVAGAISGAATMISRKVFNQVGGFDEIWYPIDYSDVNLAIKVKESLDLWTFYTPYAAGIHHESISRDLMLDDWVTSAWAQDTYLAFCKEKNWNQTNELSKL